MISYTHRMSRKYLVKSIAPVRNMFTDSRRFNRDSFASARARLASGNVPVALVFSQAASAVFMDHRR
jgi:hypothetical protein